jgi:hypothetical protein
MIRDAFINALDRKRLNGEDILTRLQDKDKEMHDAYAWKLLLHWRDQQSVFTGFDVADMLGMSISQLYRRMRKFGKINAKAVKTSQ